MPIKIIRYHFLILLILLLCVLIYSCSSSTEPKQGSLSGRIVLVNDTGNSMNDPIDFSGITVALYKLTEIDTTISRINREYPAIGIQVSQETEFDHRLQNPIITTNTDSNGNFEITSINAGTYNVVILKEGWGFRYFYNVELNTGTNNILGLDNINANDLQLYPEVHCGSIIDSSVIVSEWHHLVINEDTYFLPDSSLQLESNAILRIAQGKKIEINGQLIARGTEKNMFWITTNYGIFDLEKKAIDDIECYQSFKVMQNANIINSTIEWGKFSFGYSCVRLYNYPAICITNCTTYSIENGLLFEHCNEVYVSKMVSRGISNITNNGIQFLFTESGILEKTIVINNKTGLLIKDQTNPIVRNNYTCLNQYGIELYESNSEVKNNTITKNEFGIRIAGISTPIVTKNLIDSNVAILIGYSGYYPNATPEIHRNNIKGSDYFYKILHTSALDVNAQYNFHYTLDIEYIMQKTFDKVDYLPEAQSAVGNIIFQPILSNLENGTGVQL